MHLRPTNQQSILDKALRLDKASWFSSGSQRFDKVGDFEEANESRPSDSESVDPDANAFLSWVRKLYDAVFFFGLAPAPKKSSSRPFRRMRPSNSPFFTSAEQIGQQAIREGEKERLSPDSNSEKSFGSKRTREDLLECLADLKEELNIANITIEAYERVNGEDFNSSRMYKISQAKRRKLMNEIGELEIEIDSFMN